MRKSVWYIIIHCVLCDKIKSYGRVAPAPEWCNYPQQIKINNPFPIRVRRSHFLLPMIILFYYYFLPPPRQFPRIITTGRHSSTYPNAASCAYIIGSSQTRARSTRFCNNVRPNVFRNISRNSRNTGPARYASTVNTRTHTSAVSTITCRHTGPSRGKITGGGGMKNEIKSKTKIPRVDLFKSSTDSRAFDNSRAVYTVEDTQRFDLAI